MRVGDVMPGLVGPLNTVELYAVLAAVPLLVLFAGVWFVARRLDNYSVVDPAWALGLLWPILVLAISCWERAHAPRVALYGTMGALWSLRLGLYLGFRVAKHHPAEDVRYKVLRERWKGELGWKFFWFFEAQGLLVAMLGVPFAISFGNPARELGWIEWLGFSVWLAGIVGESVADAQMRRFKSDSGNRGKVCQVGLWRYSRHPNYFFEAVIWWGFWLFACGSPWGWVTIYAPLLILHFLLRVTGIPLTEKCAVESKGEAYREYQRSTSAFVPWRPKPRSSLR